MTIRKRHMELLGTTRIKKGNILLYMSAWIIVNDQGPVSMPHIHPEKPKTLEEKLAELRRTEPAPVPQPNYIRDCQF